MMRAGLVQRLVWLEYVPMAAFVAGWGLVGVTLGKHDAGMLFGAFVLVAAVRNFVAIDVRLPLRRRLNAGHAIPRTLWRTMWRYEAASATAGMAALVVLALLLTHSAYAAAALPLFVLAAAFPARQCGPLMARLGGEGGVRTVLLARSLGGMALFAAAWALGASLGGFAVALAARDLVALAVAAAMADAHVADGPPTPHADLAEIARSSRAMSQRRLAYRLAKALLGGTMGPFGTALARTLRRTGTLARLEATPAVMRAVLVVLLAAALIVAERLFVLGHGRGLHFAGTCGALRIAGAAASGLLWSLIPQPARPESHDDLLDDDED